jgi:hypothetical protein
VLQYFTELNRAFYYEAVEKRFEQYFAPSFRFVELQFQRLILQFLRIPPSPPPPYKKSMKLDVPQDFDFTHQIKEFGLDNIFELGLHD